MLMRLRGGQAAIVTYPRESTQSIRYERARTLAPSAPAPLVIPNLRAEEAGLLG